MLPRTALLFVFSSSFFLAAMASAGSCSTTVNCGYNPCKAPSDAVPSSLWGRLQPVDRQGLPSGQSSGHESRDTTWSDRNGSYSLNNPFWQSMDIEEDWLFVGVNRGLQIWSLASPRSPDRASYVSRSVFPSLFEAGHHTFQIKDVDAPAGESDVLALTGWSAIGMVIWDTSNKFSPRIVYQDGGFDGEKFGEEVYATTIQGRHYGFMAAHGYPGNGVWIYDLSQALANATATPCVEQRPTVANAACGGVFVGKLSNQTATHVDGAGNDSDGHFVVFSGGLRGGTGFEIWNVSDPRSPQVVMSGLGSDKVHGAALWLDRGRLYLATSVRFRDEGLIYDVSCLLDGPCALPGAPLFSFPMADLGNQSLLTVTYSESDGKPFVYFGRRSGYALSGLQTEWLFDVSRLPTGAPREIVGGDPNNGNLGQPTINVAGTTVGYWSWYYSCHPSGSNFFEPTDAMFSGRYLYRAGSSILDVHELIEPVDPTEIFDSGFETGGFGEWSATVF